MCESVTGRARGRMNMRKISSMWLLESGSRQLCCHEAVYSIFCNHSVFHSAQLLKKHRLSFLTGTEQLWSPSGNSIDSTEAVESLACVQLKADNSQVAGSSRAVSLLLSLLRSLCTSLLYAWLCSSKLISLAAKGWEMAGDFPGLRTEICIWK